MPQPSQTLSLDSPVEGWDAFHSLDNMPPTAAIVLDNMIPGAGVVDTRQGYIEYYDLGTGEPCETVASLDSAEDSKLVAASAGGMWDITDTSVEVSAAVVEELAAPGTFSSDRWQHKNFRKADESGILILCNGIDNTQIYAPALVPPNRFKEAIFTDGTDAFQYNWTMLAAADATDPGVGEWITNLAQSTLKIAWQDNGAVGHQEELQLPVGSSIKFSDSAFPDNAIVYRTTGPYVEGASWTEYPVEILAETSGGPTVGQDNITLFNPGYIEGDFIGVEVFKGRCYYWKDDDDAFYYTNAGSYQGTVSRFPLGAFVQRGGKLVMVTTWTQKDSGDGRDDFIVFVFSTGEVIVYQGDDPGGIGFFEFVGRYFMAEPLGIRGRDKYGNDIIVMTKDGYVGLSSIIQQGRTSDVSQFSRLIQNAITTQTAIRGDLYGWDCTLFAKKGLMVFNVPLSDTSFNQHVLNTVTQRWCRFKGFNVNCLEVHNERLFGGTHDGRVLALLEGTSDEGKPIEFTGLYAFNYLGNPGVHKHLTAAQVLTTHSSPEFIELTGYADFDVPVVTPLTLPPASSVGSWSIDPATPPQPVGSFWDDDFWGRGGTPFTYKGWQNVSAFGYSCALLVRFAKLNEGVSWRSTTLRFHSAGAQ
jgi:hypothetical protein